MLVSKRRVVTPEQLEFGQASLKLIRKRMFFPFISQKTRTKIVNEFLDDLSEPALAQNINVCVLQIAMTKSECKKYENTKKQVDSIVQRLPRLAKYKGRINEFVREKRSKYKLEL